MRATIATGVLTGIAVFAAQAADAPTPPAAPAADSRAVMTGDQVVQILDDTVDWYRTLGAQQQSATQPSDLLILYANQQTADKVIALAFELARANAELLSSEAESSEEGAGSATSSTLGLGEQLKRLDAQRKAIQDEIAEDRRLAAQGRKDLEAKVSELQGELDMVSARRNLLDTMT